MRNSFKEDYSFVKRKTLLLTCVLLVLFSTLLGYSWHWNTQIIYSERLYLALEQAKANWNKDASFRKWATLHGGVYVKPDERTPPNTALSHIPNRDITTTDGQRLTLMNPAYMMRQMTQEFEKDYGIKGKITGKVQLNPINKPDEWQLKVLDQFESGKTGEVYEEQIIEGKPYLRYMKPMYMTKGCVKCHGFLGFKDGDLRGGVSISIPMEQYLIAADKTINSITITYSIIWSLGVVGILFFTWLTHQLLLKMARNTLYDDLTDLPNLTLFKNRLNKAFKKFNRDPKHLFAVAFLDLNRFKVLNDSRGHKTGDKLLVALSQRISEKIRPGDTIARMGGDEFTFLFNDFKNVNELMSIADRIQGALKQPFNINNDKIYIGASIGICLVSKDYNNTDDMIRDADIAMYRAKMTGDGYTDLFNPDMHRFAEETLTIENDLRLAIDNKQFELFYQPVINLKFQTIEGFEALLRWHHPVLGLVPPDRFIPIAETSGQIKQIGDWVLKEACTQVHEWNLQFSSDNELSVAVNLSGIQLSDEHFIQNLQTIVDECRLEYSLLHLEVTETALIANKDQTKIALSNIRELGIKTSIDDFGKGYCSLTYLQDFDFDTLKIDKDFVQDMTIQGKGLQLVRTLLLLARDLKMNVIAEGVETDDQFNRLKSMGCNFIQGYYFSKPRSAKDIKQLLKKACHHNADLLLAYDDTVENTVPSESS